MFFWKRKKKQTEETIPEENTVPVTPAEAEAPAEGAEAAPAEAESEAEVPAEPEAETVTKPAAEEPAEENAAEPVEKEPAEEPAAEPAVKESAEEEPAAESVEEAPVEEPEPEAPAEEPETPEEPAEEPAEEEPAAESVEEAPVEEPAAEPVEEESAEEPEPEAPAEEAAEETETSAKEEPAGEPEASAEEAAEEAETPEEPAEEEPAAETVEEESAEEPEPEAPAEEAEMPEEPAKEEPAAEPAEVPVEEETTAEPVEEEPAEEPEPEAPAEEAAEETETPEEPSSEAPAAEPEEEPEVYEKEKSGILRRFLLFTFLLLFVMACSYYYGITYAETHFLENTYINNMDVSNMTAPEVEKLFYANTKDYSITINYRGGDVETVYGEQFGYKIKPDGSIGRILSQQDPYRWYQCFFRRTDAEVELKTTYDPVKLKEVVQALTIMQEENMVKSKNAYITLSDTTFEIVPEVEGTYFDTSKVLQAVDEAAQKEETEVDVVALGVYEEPSVRAKDEDIVKKCDDLNHLVAGSITWDLPGGEKMTIDKNTTIDWLSQDEKGNYYRDEDLWEEKVEVYVDELAMKVNTVGSDWDFNATGVGDITVDGGDYGYSVNKVDEREDVLELLLDGDTDEREPYYYSKEFQGSGSGIGDTYIEANLSQQHVWIYVDGRMVCDTDCVSGNTSLGRGTPTGVFQIMYKDTDVDLKGMQLADGQYSYISHVNYWMPFYSGCGFHDADWRSNFGGSIYRSNGSHGCINLPPSIAPTFYSYVQAGMPVVVFY